MSDYEKSCQYCGVILTENDEVVETGHGDYHKECAKYSNVGEEN